MKTIIIPKKFNAKNFLAGQSTITIATVAFPIFILLFNYESSIFTFVLFGLLQGLIVYSLVSVDIILPKRIMLHVLHLFSTYKYIDGLRITLETKKQERKLKYDKKIKEINNKNQSKIKNYQDKIEDIKLKYKI